MGGHWGCWHAAGSCIVDLLYYCIQRGAGLLKRRLPGAGDLGAWPVVRQESSEIIFEKACDTFNTPTLNLDFFLKPKTPSLYKRSGLLAARGGRADKRKPPTLARRRLTDISFHQIGTIYCGVPKFTTQ